MNVRHVAGFAILAAVIGACVIAEPATELPELPAQPPTIDRAGVVPSPNVVLTKWPVNSKFYVPVRLTDPRITFNYATFVDYNPVTREGLGIRDESRFDIAGSSPRLLELNIVEQTGDRCQVIEVVVALSLSDVDPHTLPRSGGDSVTWFYSPGGDLAGCPTLPTTFTPDAAALQSQAGRP